VDLLKSYARERNLNRNIFLYKRKDIFLPKETHNIGCMKYLLCVDKMIKVKFGNTIFDFISAKHVIVQLMGKPKKCEA